MKKLLLPAILLIAILGGCSNPARLQWTIASLSGSVAELQEMNEENYNKLVWCDRDLQMAKQENDRYKSVLEKYGILETSDEEKTETVSNDTFWEKVLWECGEIQIPAYRGDMDLSKYPENINLSLYSTVKVTARLSDYFVENYKYEDSDFQFAVKVFVWGDTDNWGYYDVLRTRQWGVANRSYLKGAVSAKQLKDWYTWEIPLHDNIYVANNVFVEGMQFKQTNMSKYVEDNQYTKIGAYVSSTKELKWWELADITLYFCK